MSREGGDAVEKEGWIFMALFGAGALYVLYKLAKG